MQDKGDMHFLDNAKPASLPCVISKRYASIWNTRLNTLLEENDKIVLTQAGLRRNYSTTDQSFNLYTISQCFSKECQKLYAAFDSIRHDKLLQAVQQKGVKGKCATVVLYQAK